MNRKELFNLICNQLEINGYRDIYFDGNEIICCSQERADAIADFLEAIGIDNVMTGQCGLEMFYINID